MSVTDFISIGFGLMALLVTTVGIIVTVALTRISHVQSYETNRVLQTQQFETTFFNLLNSQNAIISNIQFYNAETQTSASGRQSFMLLYRLLNVSIRNVRTKRYYRNLALGKDVPLSQIILSFERIMEVLNKMLPLFKGGLGHYYRNLFFIINFINEQKGIDKYKYISIVTAQMSVYEVAIMYYYCLSIEGKQFKYLVNSFRLLNSLDRTLLFKYGERKKEDFYEFELNTH